MQELEKKRLTPKQWARLASHIIMIHDPLPYLDQIRAAATDLVTRKLSIIPEGVPFPATIPIVEPDFMMEAHWIWTGSVIPEQKGKRLKRDSQYIRYSTTFYQPPYSVVSIDGVRTSAHRAFYEHFVEAFEVEEKEGSGRRWSAGKLVQDCGVPLCVNPRHWHHQLAPKNRKDWNPHERVYAVESETETAPKPSRYLNTPQQDVDELLEILLASPTPPSSWDDVISHVYFDEASGIDPCQTIQAIHNSRKLHLLPKG